MTVGPFQFGDGADGDDGSADTVQPKGRWAQRFDQNLAFKSQLDLTQPDDDMGQSLPCPCTLLSLYSSVLFLTARSAMGFRFLSLHFGVMGWGWGVLCTIRLCQSFCVSVLDCRYPHLILTVSQSVLEYQILCVFSSFIMGVLCIY